MHSDTSSTSILSSLHSDNIFINCQSQDEGVRWLRGQAQARLANQILHRKSAKKHFDSQIINKFPPLEKGEEVRGRDRKQEMIGVKVKRVFEIK